ncbi:MAG: hypothetical protein J3K34DRAFT_525291 [Monoraphidium minutum]|nr:MAG: hypothetical protein J3K34DRAFT_525291 [Monoraphidium minutum]
MEDRRRSRNPGHLALHAATALIALKVGVRLVRAAGKALQGASGQRVAPEPEDPREDEAHGDAPPTARDQSQPCAAPPPAPPPGAVLVAAADLPISVYQFYEQFLGIGTTCLQDHHVASGQAHFRSSRWKADGDGGLARVFTFVQPKKGIASAPARCTQQQRLCVHPGGVLSLTTEMQPADIPYGDSFRVQSFWTARPDGAGPGCRVEIRVAVPFRKWCVLKGVITKASVSDCREFFRGFLEKVSRAAAELAPSPGGRAGAVAAAASPFARGGAAAGADGEVHISWPGDRRPSRVLSSTAKAAFGLPAPDVRHLPWRVALTTRQLVHLHTLLLAVVLLLQAALLLELLSLRAALGGGAGGGALAALPRALPRALGGALGAARGAAAWLAAGGAAAVNGGGL